MQHIKKNQILRILSLVLVLVLTLSCFAACGNDSGEKGGSGNGGSNGNNSASNGNTATNGNGSGNNANPDFGNNSSNNSGSSNNPSGSNDSGNSGSNTNPDPDKLTEYFHDGLTYYLGKDFDCIENKSRMKHTRGTTILWVAGATTPSSVTDARRFADFFVSQAQNSGYTATRRYQNGVYYTVTELNDGITEVRGFYFYNNYGWCIYATSDHYTSESAALVQYITSGVIDKDYQHNSGNSSSSSNSTVSPGDPSHPDFEKPDEPDTPTNKPVINGTQHSFNGLNYQLGKDYNAVNMGDYMMHSNGSTSIVVMGGSCDKTNSKALAADYYSKMLTNNLKCQIDSQNNIYYVVTDLGDGTVEIRGFYGKGDRFWNIYATTYDFDKEESILISYITSGVIN